MAELMSASAYCGAVLSLGTFFLGDWLKKKLKWRFLNPLLLSILFTLGFLLVVDLIKYLFSDQMFCPVTDITVVRLICKLAGAYAPAVNH